MICEGIVNSIRPPNQNKVLIKEVIQSSSESRVTSAARFTSSFRSFYYHGTHSEFHGKGV